MQRPIGVRQNQAQAGQPELTTSRASSTRFVAPVFVSRWETCVLTDECCLSETRRPRNHCRYGLDLIGVSHLRGPVGCPGWDPRGDRAE